MYKKYIISLISLVFLSGCSVKEEYALFHNNNTTIEQFQQKNIKFEYKILPYDRISLIVYRHPEFSTPSTGTHGKDDGLLVDSEGFVSLPVVDDIHIAGLTQKEARKKIEDKFSHYLKYSKIKLEVLNKRVYVTGEVKNPGELELKNEKSTLLKIIAKANGMTNDADRKNILILRDNGIKTQVRKVNLIDFNSVEMASLMILPNDIIYVAPKHKKSVSSKLNEYDRVLGLVGHVLSPFVNIKYLSN